jgi:hypothetical protein
VAAFQSPAFVSCNFINSILANVTSVSSGSPTLSGQNNGFYLCSGFGTSQFSTSVSPFAQQGAGNYYLNTDPNSGGKFRNAGTTTGVSSSLLSALWHK